MLFVLVIAAEPKKATVAAEPVVLDTAEATANVVRRLLQAKAPARRACNATLSAAAAGGGVNETELSDRGRIVAHIEQRACRAVDTTTPAALGSSGVLVLLLSCCCCWCCCRRWSRKGRAKRARRRRARALEKESLRTAGDSAGTEL